MTTQPRRKRLNEVTFPLEGVSAHSRGEKNVRHGHISTLHFGCILSLVPRLRGAGAYQGLNRQQGTIKHGIREYVRSMVHTKLLGAAEARGHGVCHHFSPKHLGRYVDEFEGRHSSRPLDTRVPRGLCRAPSHSSALLRELLQRKRTHKNGPLSTLTKCPTKWHSGAPS